MLGAWKEPVMTSRKLAIFCSLTLALGLGGCGEYREAKDAVRATMIDPDAVQFRDLGYCPSAGAIIYGQANGKNMLGAYTGFHQFYYTEHRAFFAGDSEFEALTDRCFKKGPATSAAASVAAIPVSAPSKSSATHVNSDDREVSKLAADKEGELEPAIVKTAAELCWRDYCPCDTGDPDYGGADVTLCRNLKGGLPVDDQMFAAGAALRDGRRQLREFGSFN